MEKIVMEFYIKLGNESANQRITYITVKPYRGKNIKGYAKRAISDQFDVAFDRELVAYPLREKYSCASYQICS